MNEIKTVVFGIGKHKKELIAKIGRSSWVYSGVPTRGYVRRVQGRVTEIVEVWFFDFALVESDVQQAMVISVAKLHAMPLDKARDFCAQNATAIPCAQIKLMYRRNGYR